MPKKPRKTPGPEADRLKLQGDWEANVRKALSKTPPPGGWPKPGPKPEQKPEPKPGKPQRRKIA